MLNIKNIKTVGSNILYLVSGNIISLILGFLFNIYIAKTLGASEYGIFSTVGAFTGMFGFLIFEGYQSVAIRECCGNKENLVKVIENILGIKTALSFFAVICTIISSFFLNYSTSILLYISIFSFTLLFGSLSSMFKVVYHVNLKMKYIAYTNLIQKLIYIVPAAISIWFKGGVEYLIVFFTLSTFLDMFIHLYILKKFFSISLSFKYIFKYNVNLTFFKEAFVFSLLGFIGYFWSTIDITMLSLMVSTKSVGIYSAAIKLVMPFELVGRMTKIALFPQVIKIFKIKNTIKATQLFKMSGIIAACLIPGALILSFFSEQLIFFIFGKEYSGSAEVLKYLCWMVPFDIITLPFVMAMQANHHEKKIILPNILRALSNVILNYIFIKKYGYMGAVYSTVLTYFWYFTIVNIGYQYYVLKKAGNIV